MDENINNPHDKFVKAMLSDKEVAISFFDTYLPGSLRPLLDLETLQYTQTSYITDSLKETFSDIVVDIKLSDRDEHCFVSILLEHKSTISEHAAFQLLGYIANGYNTQIKHGESIQPIIPYEFA
ncbi:MAG: Rpn family recombination-promoting nuclease/putative transposase [Saprospiraceae bacterium]